MLYYKIANYLLIALGFGHNSMVFLTKTDNQGSELEQLMKSTEFLKMNIYDMNLGFSLMMGFLFIIIGILNLSNLSSSKLNILINIIMSVLLTVMSFTYFFYIPQTFSVLILLFFILSYRKVIQ
jgi:hypothetical protein